jgi:hypothetical protein
VLTTTRNSSSSRPKPRRNVIQVIVRSRVREKKIDDSFFLPCFCVVVCDGCEEFNNKVMPFFARGDPKTLRFDGLERSRPWCVCVSFCLCQLELRHVLIR